MATLTYDLYTGVLIARSDRDPSTQIFATAISGGSNYYEFAGVRQVKKHGARGHVHGGPIPIGRWKLHPPGSSHPDRGRLRSHWIPIGPVSHRTHLYIHPRGTLTEGCIAVDNTMRFVEIRNLVEKEKGGVIFVLAGRDNVLV
jgi:hypothetical protein